MQVLLLSSRKIEIFTMKTADGWLRIWNVTRGYEFAQEGHELMRFPLFEQGLTAEGIVRLYPRLNEQHAMTTDLCRPLLFIPFFGEPMLLDGWHRAYKAARLGIPELPMYLLTKAEADTILLLALSPEKQKGGTIQCHLLRQH